MLNKIRSSSSIVYNLSDDVFINDEQIINVSKLLNKEEILKWSHSIQDDTGLLYDINIDHLNNNNYKQMDNKTRNHINFLCIVDILNFASGFRHNLHNYNSKGAYSTIHAGVVTLFNDSPLNLFANKLKDISLEKIKESFNLNTNDTVLSNLCKMIQNVLQETGLILENNNKHDFAEYIWDFTLSNTSVESLIENLVLLFPGFRDIHNYKNNKIYIIKKAQLLCADLYRHFHKTIPSHFNFSDINQLTIMSDNVIPAVLRKFGILILSQDLQEYIDSAQILPSGNREIELRSIAIHACELLYKEWQKQHIEDKEFLNIMKLDYYLWCKGKDPEFRKVERHYTQDTIFY